LLSLVAIHSCVTSHVTSFRSNCVIALDAIAMHLRVYSSPQRILEFQLTVLWSSSSNSVTQIFKFSIDASFCVWWGRGPKGARSGVQPRGPSTLAELQSQTPIISSRLKLSYHQLLFYRASLAIDADRPSARKLHLQIYRTFENLNNTITLVP